MRLEIATTHQTACYSVLSQYHRQLFERYGLLFFYAGDVETKVSEYMNENFGQDTIGAMLGARDLLALKAEESQKESITLATDSKGMVLRRQCVECMEEKYAITYLEQMTEWLQTMNDRGLLEEEITFRVDGKEWSEHEIKEQGNDSPLRQTKLPSTFRYLEQAALKLLVGGKELSQKKLATEDRVSERPHIEGDGLSGDSEFENNWWDRLLFAEYVLHYTGNYVSPLDDGHLVYQTEYILSGEEEDGANLWNVANKLLKVRTAANALSILANENRSEPVKELSVSLAAALGNQEIEPLIYVSIVLIWAEIEGIYDVRNLLKGESVGLLKAEEDWLIDVSFVEGLAEVSGDSMTEDIANLDDRFDENCEYGSGIKTTGDKEDEKMYYADYLRLLLWTQNGETTALRLMDIIESDIRAITQQNYFFLDMYADRFRVKTRVTSAHDKEFWITGEYGY